MGGTDTDDEHSALTSQTLNADGTPKRPMNAFMIFARRRRPQVSAANQSMRTGEISKILSKEWNSMQSIEKQFYQDQAKQLKDAFNMRYPDYVYRRRPNNSRRKRKPEASGIRQVDSSVSMDMGDDVSGLGELFTDVEETQEDALDSHEAYQGNPSDHRFPSSHARSFSYPYPEMDPSLRSNGAGEGSLLYGQHSAGMDQLYHGQLPSASIVPPQLPPHSLTYPFRSHSYPAPQFEAEYSYETYETPVARPVPWPPGSDHDRIALQRSHSFSPSTERLVWPRSTSVPSKPTLNPTSSHAYELPTLNSPFSPVQISQSSISSSLHSSHPRSTSHSPFNSSAMLHTSSPKLDHSNYMYSSTPSGSPVSVTSGQDASLYSRGNINPYLSHFHPPPHSSLPSSGQATPQPYWSGD